MFSPWELNDEQNRSTVFGYANNKDTTEDKLWYV